MYVVPRGQRWGEKREETGSGELLQGEENVLHSDFGGGYINTCDY